MHSVSFGSDNHSRVHPLIMESFLEINKGYAVGYGDDQLTKEVLSSMKRIFGGNCDIWLVMTGTGANVLAIQILMKSFQYVICSNISHINVDECGAIQKFTQGRLVPVYANDGKLNPKLIEPVIDNIEEQHHSQKRIISISQSTEYGTLYTLSELRSLADFAHQNNLLLHVDGARLANAAAALGVSLKTMTCDTGVDIISFGGTKNGMMFGEAIISFHPELTHDMIYYRKQATQLFSKMRYISCQFKAYMNRELWLRNARHANNAATILSEKLRNIEGIIITQKVEVNAVFAKFPPQIIPHLQDKYHFYMWNKEQNEVRLMCSFETSEQDIDNFIYDLKCLIGKHS